MSFASNVITLKPEDVVSMGSPAGVGAGRSQPVFIKDGDVSVCTIEGIGHRLQRYAAQNEPATRELADL